METLSLFTERWQKAKSQPFLDHQPMTGTPLCAWKNFYPPLLRQFDPQAKIVWKERLGCGLDGIVWKAEYNGRSCAVKVFWDNTPPEDRYWAIQQECHNAALLQILQAAIGDTNTPIYLNPDPKTRKQALINLHAFSDEGRHKEKLKQLSNAFPCTSIPPIRECFGWTKVIGRELWSLSLENSPPSDTLKRCIWPHEEYYAIVYDFIPEGQSLDRNVVQSQLDFYYRAGFCLTAPMRADNWKGRGILIDMADLICPWHVGWSESMFLKRRAEEILVEV
ncbi:hypothetical protein LY78DRAFT_648083 [Colletotrichum sublineola]|nr:hypothetical protein LY78DRAFT_648083 [Colletotrichum sublineola]